MFLTFIFTSAVFIQMQQFIFKYSGTYRARLGKIVGKFVNHIDQFSKSKSVKERITPETEFRLGTSLQY